MIWKQEDIRNGVFEYKGIRHIELLHKGKEYIVEVTAFSVEKGSYTTEVWLVGKNDKIKVIVEIIDRQVLDKECIEMISIRFNDWIYDYESLVRKSIFVEDSYER